MLNKALMPSNEFNSCTRRLFDSKTQLAVKLRCGQIVTDVEFHGAPSRDCDATFFSMDTGITWALNGSHYRKKALDIVAVGKKEKLIWLDTLAFVCEETDEDEDFYGREYDCYNYYTKKYQDEALK